MTKKVKTIHNLPDEEAMYDRYGTCLAEAEQKCLGKIVCTACGNCMKVHEKIKFNEQHKLGGKKTKRELTVQEMGRQRAMCADDNPLAKREKKELIKIAGALGVIGISKRTTKKDLCAKIRTAMNTSPSEMPKSAASL